MRTFMSRIMREPQAVCLHQSTLTCNFSLPAFESSPLPQHDIWDLHDDEQVGADAAVLRPPEPGRRLGRPRAFHGESQGPATGGDLFQKVEPGNRDATPASGGDSGAASRCHSHAPRCLLPRCLLPRCCLFLRRLIRGRRAARQRRLLRSLPRVGRG